MAIASLAEAGKTFGRGFTRMVEVAVVMVVNVSKDETFLTDGAGNAGAARAAGGTRAEVGTRADGAETKDGTRADSRTGCTGAAAGACAGITKDAAVASTRDAGSVRGATPPRFGRTRKVAR